MRRKPMYKKRLGKILGKYYKYADSENPDEQNEISMSIIQGEIDWMVSKVEETEQNKEKLKDLDKDLDKYYGTTDNWELLDLSIKIMQEYVEWLIYEVEKI